jgi:cyclophilin family peptidyl-prolyl cis-trans isomerase/HEAT repeat protein
MAFASLQDTMVSELILAKLHDNVEKVRAASAYALGQMGQTKYQDSLIAVFGLYDTLNPNNQFNSNILEAIGKVGDKKYLKSLATIKTYRPTDTLLILGQTKGLFRFITRKLSIPEGTEKILDLIDSKIYPIEIRTFGSNYLVRAEGKDLQNYTFRLTKIFKKESNPFIKMNVAIALGKTKNKEALLVLKEVLLDQTTDPKVKINIIKALSNFEYIDVIETILLFLENENNALAMTAADYLYNFGEPNDVTIYRRYTKKGLEWNVKAKLFSAILKHVPIYFSKTKSASIWDVKKGITNSENPYEKAAYVKALGEDVNSYKILYKDGFQAPETLVRVASLEALNTLVKREELLKLPKWRLKKFIEETKIIITESFASKDPGLLSSIVDVLINSKVDFKQEFEKLDFIDGAKKSLELPKDIEAHEAILRLEQKWFNKTFTPTKIKYNNPIDWFLFDELGDNPRAKIKTNRGVFTFKLLKNESPASVINFVKLANDHFFDGKKFHRVVPNFVIQTGCTRGDGYGSLNYTIRSELGPLSYDHSGIVGMASAGKDTESTQWFVTLAPAPHLDGRYTIFGKVINGNNTFENIMVSDIIEEVKVLK